MSFDPISLLVFLAVFGAMTAVLLHLSGRLRGDVWWGVHRLRQLSGPGKETEDRDGLGRLVRAVLVKSGEMLLAGRNQQARLEARLTQAGLNGPGSVRLFLGARLVLAMLCPAAALVACSLGKVSLSWTLVACTLAAGAGGLAPGLWVDRRKARRQANLRRALPDALDLLVLCLDGGGTLPSAIQRVTEDLGAAHPLLAAEWGLIQREMRLGLSAGEAVRRFGERCDLEDVRDLAAVLLQSERFGTGMAKALRLHADSFRLERQQRAEEAAQKAGVKILFPTLLCIFPAIFIVLLGPAAFQIAKMLSKGR